MERRIFDSHVHIGYWGTQSINDRNITPFHGRELDSPDKVLAYLDKWQIEKAVLLPIYSPDRNHAYGLNSLVLATSKWMPDRIIPGFWIDPSPSMRDRLDTTLKMAQDNGIRVLKTASQTWETAYSPDPVTWDSAFADTMNSVLDYAGKYRAIIQMHTGSGKSDIRIIEKLIRYASPNVTFHLVHMGHTVDGQFYLVPRLKEWRASGLDVVCDTSWSGGFAVRWLFDLAAEDGILRDAIMFASDEPWGLFQAELSKVADAAIGKQELLDAVLWSNAARVYCR